MKSYLISLSFLLSLLAFAGIAEAGSSTAYVDYVRITVYYTATSAGTPQVQIRSGILNVKSGAMIIK